jgi:hypothetical protein
MTLNEMATLFLTPSELIKFKNNVIALEVIGDMDSECEHGHVFISCSFVWSDSPEGMGYWCEIDERVITTYDDVMRNYLNPPKDPIIYTTISKHRMI